MPASDPRHQQRLDVVSMVLGLVFGFGTNLVTASPDRWWRPLRVIDRYAAVWLFVLLFAVLGRYFTSWFLHNRRVSWRHAESPFPGLMPFTADRSEVFFGRDAETAELLRRLTRPGVAPSMRFVPVVGPSGSGKTSLIAAGALPRLSSSQWTVIGPLQPGHSPFHALAEALLAAMPHDADARVQSLDEQANLLREEAAVLSPDLDPDRARRAVLGSLPASLRVRRRRVIVVVDQFEQLNTHTTVVERRLFLSLLRRALEELPYLHIVVALPADALPSFGTSEHGALFAHPFRVGPMDTQRLRDAIVRPAAASGVEFDSGVVEQMLAEATIGDALPLLAHLLERLHLTHGGDGHITVEEFNRAGRVIGAITEHADEVLGELSALFPVEEIDGVLLRFVASNGHEVYRRHVPVADLEGDAVRIVGEFRAARLIADTADGRAYALAHDALLRQWEHLRDLVAANGERLRRISLLESRAADWLLSGRRVDDLLRGDALSDAQRLIASQPVSPRLRDYLQASEGESDEDMRRRSDRIATRAQEIRSNNRSMAIALARTAVTELAATPASTLTLWGLTASPAVSTFPIGHVGRVLALEWRSDGSEVLSIAADRSVCAWRRNGELTSFTILPEDEFRGFRDVVLAPGASHFVALTENGQSIVWSYDKARRLAMSSWEHSRLTASRSAWSPDGQRLATALDFTNIDIWDFSDTLDGIRGPIRPVRLALPCSEALAWAPDGAHLASICGESLRIASLEDPGAEPLHIPLKKPCKFLCWTPDGQSVTVGEKHRGESAHIKTFDAISGDLRSSWLTANAESVVWAPDGAVIAVLHKPGIASLLQDDDETKADGKAPKNLLSLRDGHGSVLQEHQLDEWMDMLCWSPASNAIAFVRKLGSEVVVLNLTDGEVAKTGGGRLRAVAWSPARSRAYVVWGAAYRYSGVAHPVSVDSTAITPQHLCKGRSVRAAVWSPNGRHVALHAADVEVWDGGFTGDAIARLDDAPGFVRALVWAPDGHRIAMSTHDFVQRQPSRVTVWDALHGRELAAMSREAMHSCPITWSPDGADLAGVDGDGAIVIWDSVTGQVARAFSPLAGNVKLLAWSPNGRVIASSGEDGTVHLWDSAAGAVLMSLPGHTDQVRKAAWSPDGTILATGDTSTLRLWDADMGASLAVLDIILEGIGSVLDVSWSPDGGSISVTAGDNSIRTWTLPGDPAEVLSCADASGVPELSAVDRDRYGLPTHTGRTRDGDPAGNS